MWVGGTLLNHHPGLLAGLQARLELLALVGQLYSSLRSRFDADDTARVFMWVEKFSRNPWSGERGAGCRCRFLCSAACLGCLPG